MTRIRQEAGCLQDVAAEYSASSSDGYVDRNRAWVDRRIDQARRDMIDYRRDGDEIGVLMARCDLAYFTEAKQNNEGGKWTGALHRAAQDALTAALAKRKGASVTPSGRAHVAAMEMHNGE